MPEMKVYFNSDGSITIRWPKGTYPDRDTLKRLSELIIEHRKSPSANGSTQKGSTENGAVWTM